MHVFDPSMKPLSLINMILCYVSHTAYPEMLNQGYYKAQTDIRLCEEGEESSDQGGASGQSAGAQAAEFMLFTVNSSRATADSDQIVTFWVPENEGGTIHAKMTISEAASEADPFGSFLMDYTGVSDGGTEADAEMFGALGTIEQEGTSGFQLFENEGDIDQPHDQPRDFSKRIAVALSTEPDSDTGLAHILEKERANDFSGDTGILARVKVAYDATHFKRQLDSGPEVTFSRTDFHNTAWRYNLYHATGENAGSRVELDSGFGFQTEGGDYGWVGYFGLWVPDDVTVANGDTITENDFDGGAGATYTVVRAPGKLIRHVRQTMELAELEGHTFNWWDNDNGTNYLLDYASGFFQQDRLLGQREATDRDRPAGWSTSSRKAASCDVVADSAACLYIDESVVTYFPGFVNGSARCSTGHGDFVTLYGYIQRLT